MTELKQFFGDAEHVFKLTVPLIIELERKLNCGVGGLAKRLLAGEWRAFEVHEIVRLALTGGGTDPAEAHALIQAYGTPLMPLYAIAVGVIDQLMFGDKTDA